MGAAVIPPPSSTSRGLPTNPAQGIRRIPFSDPTMPPPPPIPEKFHVSSNSAGSTLSIPSQPLSPAQVIALAREAMNTALKDNETKAAEASGVSTELKPGLTINLSHMNIQSLPEEVVDIIKNELERLALSHNKLTSFPVRFSECTSLRYLNVRNNYIKEIPLPLCDLKSLEILDLGRNRIRVLPPEIAKLSSLKVLSVQKNRIQELPLCLADMVSLAVLKLDGNDITFPPKEVFQVQATSPPNEVLKESEVNELTATTHIKRFLRQQAQNVNGRDREAENGGDELSEGTETPRVPRRVASGRFPIRVNGNEVTDPRSPALIRPPPIPSRSHARGLSQQNTAIRRPSVMPLTIGNPNERLRSNSETVLQTPRGERPSERYRRMGIVSRKASELGTLDEGQANNRFSHYRGLSHGSSMTGNMNPNSISAVSPNSPAEPLLQRPNYVRRLSVLPEQRRESKVVDPILESAKGILYSIFQIHPMIQLFTRLTGDGTAKRSSLEIVFYNTNVHVEELEQEIQKHDFAVESGNYAPRENENVQRAVLTLINAYSHVCSLLIGNMDTIVGNADPRYIRTMMVLLYNSTMELRVAANEVAMGFPGYMPSNKTRRPPMSDTIRLHSRESSVTPTAGRPSLRTRPGAFVHNPSNLRVATDVTIPYINGTGRTAQIASATPRSGESFASVSTDGRYAGSLTAEEQLFDKIFLSLQKSTDLVLRTLPSFNIQLSNAKRGAEFQRAPEHIIQCWKALIVKCGTAIRDTETLKNRLSMIKLKEPGIRTDPIFWRLCKNFMYSWAEYGSKLKSSMDQIQLPQDIKGRLKPIQVSIQETNQLINSSPWTGFRYASTLNNSGSYSDGSHHYSPGHYSSHSAISQMQLPMTPQSAALGPAVQATVPSTPQSASFANAFTGNVFERADALISMGGVSMSRTGTMNSMSSVSLHSMPSMSSLSSVNSTLDDRPGLSTMLSPNGNMGGYHPYRVNGGSKPSF
ncbi:RAM signaling pathway protein [Xylariomycetidae sp. FL2044]|nr:RAM signaling pathway protein [Xylariomycetidae sp. FL2044]